MPTSATASPDNVNVATKFVKSVPFSTSIVTVWLGGSIVASPVCSAKLYDKISFWSFCSTVTVTVQSWASPFWAVTV